MKTTLINSFINTIKYSLLVVPFLFCCLAFATPFSVDSPDNNDYEKLKNRTDKIKIFYTIKEGSVTCHAEIALNSRIWVSDDQKINKDLFNRAPLPQCLSHDKAKQILSQTFVEFGRGL